MKLSDIIIWILFIITLVFIFWYIFGNSPTFEQTILVFVVTAIFTIAIKISQFGSRMGYVEKDLRDLKINIKDSFNNIKNDISLIKKRLNIK